MKLSEIFLGESAHHFQGDSLSRPSGTVRKKVNTPCSGWEVARSSEATYRGRLGDTSR